MSEMFDSIRKEIEKGDGQDGKENEKKREWSEEENNEENVVPSKPGILGGKKKKSRGVRVIISGVLGSGKNHVSDTR